MVFCSNCHLELPLELGKTTSCIATSVLSYKIGSWIELYQNTDSRRVNITDLNLPMGTGMGTEKLFNKPDEIILCNQSQIIVCNQTSKWHTMVNWTIFQTIQFIQSSLHWDKCNKMKYVIIFHFTCAIEFKYCLPKRNNGMLCTMVFIPKYNS